MSEQVPSMACAIRQEAARFETLHQTLDNLHNLLQEIDNIPVKIRMRELVNNIEDCFQHSPEFKAIKPTSDYELKLGVVGSITSGKSALIHHYLTGECPKEERLNGCHKKEVLVDGQSYLLLVRNETGSPDCQFVYWLDALMLVFNVDDELSSSVLPGYYARMSQYRDFSEIPLFLIGIKDHGTNCTSSPNHCNQIRRRLSDVNNCTYIEVCLETGESVGQMFQLASEKMANRESAVLTSYDTLLSPPTVTDGRPTSVSSTVSGSSSRTTGTVSPSSTPKPRTSRRRTIIFGTKTDKVKDEIDADQEIGIGRYIPVKQGNLLKRTTKSLNKEWKKKFVVLNDGGILTYYPSLHDYIENVHGKHIFLKQSTVKIPGKMPPVATNQGRTASPKHGSQGGKRTNSLEDEILRNHDGGENGALVISNEFLTQDNEPEIKSALSTTANHIMAAVAPAVLKSKPEAINRSESIPRKRGRNRNHKKTKSCELDFSNLPEDLQQSLMNAANTAESQNSQTQRTTPATTPSTTPATTPSDGKERKWPVTSESRLELNNLSGGSLKKKAHRRSKSHGTTKMFIANDTKSDTRNGNVDEYEFKLVSLDGKSWNFAAQSLEEREKWVLEIEQQILTSLQSNLSGRDKMNSNSSSESDLQPIRLVAGNNVCADCGEPNPDWATLNLGALICIACCGFHRNLGTHVSRVRSLDLDEWPSELRTVMLSIGNSLANSIWEARAQPEAKPKPSSSREDKERWIRAKYQHKEFLKPLSTSKHSLGQRLVEAVLREDLSDVILLLAHSNKKDVNEREDDDLLRTPLHISSSKGNVVLTLLLIWYFADVTLLDGQGRTALWYARESGSRECEEILRYNGCHNMGRSLSCSGSSNSGDLTS